MRYQPNHQLNFAMSRSPKNTIPSIQRSQAFLWLVHRFLETPELVASDFANGEARLPEDQLLNLTRQDCSNENVDPEEELAFGLEMQRNRDEFVERYMKPENYEFGNEASAASGEFHLTSDRRFVSLRSRVRR